MEKIYEEKSVESVLGFKASPIPIHTNAAEAGSTLEMYYVKVVVENNNTGGWKIYMNFP